MKKTILLILLGILLGIGGMFIMSRPEAPPPASQVDFLEFTAELPGDALSMTHGIEGMMIFPEGIADLKNTPISNMMGISTRIRGKDGEYVGLASELELFPNDKGLRPGMKWKTYWTFMTFDGALFVYEIEAPPLAHLPMLSSLAQGKDWTGSIPADTSVGPHPSGRGIIVGGTGAYAGASGTFVERIDLRGFTVEGKITGTLYLQLYLDKKKGAEQ